MQVAALLETNKQEYQTYLAGMTLVAIVCYVCVQINANFSFVGYHFTLFDMVSGVSLGVLLTKGIRYWPAILVGIVCGFYTAGEALQYAVVSALVMTSTVMVAAYFLSQYLHQNYKLDYIPELIKYLLMATFIVAVVGGSVHTLVLILFSYAPASEASFIWFNACLGKLTGIIVVTPLIMVWSQKNQSAIIWPKFAEMLMLMVVLVFCGGIVFLGWFDTNISGYSRYPIAYIFFPILAWAAFRFGQKVSTSTSIIFAGLALWSLDNNLGPFSRGSLYESYILTWLCINTASISAIILAADISYCKKVRVALRHSEERLDVATSGSQDGLWDWTDITRDTMWWSPNFYELLGYRDNEIKPSQQQLLDLMHPDDRVFHSTALNGHADRGEPYNIDFRLLTKSLGYRWFHAKAKITRDERSGAERMAGSIIDIDDRKNAQVEINELNDHLEQRVNERTNELAEINKDLHREISERNKAELEIVKLQNDLIHMGRIMTMGEMASALAHELHQPLMAIVNYSQSTLLDIEQGQQGRRGCNVIGNNVTGNIERISEQALRGGEIIRNMKAFSVRGKIQFEHFDVNELVLQLRPLLEIEVTQNNIDLTIDLDKKEMIANINHIQMQQVIINLAKNSIEAMKYNSHGKVLIIKTRQQGDDVRIEVIDNGPGVEENSTDNVFDAFYTTKSEGLGLGLSISYKIIEAHNGKLTLRNCPQGTIACIDMKLIA